MGNHLLKTPLTAVLYAALLHFVFVFPPFSPGYAEVRAAFVMPRTGYLFLIVYGLWISAILALIFGGAKAAGMKLALLSLAPLLGAQWAVPMFQPILYGETSGVMARSDLLLTLACCCGASAVLLLLAALLFKAPPAPQPAKPAPQKPAEKFRIKKADLAIKLLVLPVIYCVIYFIAWYFLLWRVEAARVYYAGSTELRSFIGEIINMLLTSFRLVPLALIRGLAFSLFLLPLLMPLASKRVIFIVTAVMLFLCPGVLMLIPSPVMPDAVRTAHLVETCAACVLYGVLAGFMLHTSLQKEVVAPPPAAARPKPQTGAPAKVDAAQAIARAAAAIKK